MCNEVMVVQHDKAFWRGKPEIMGNILYISSSKVVVDWVYSVAVYDVKSTKSYPYYTGVELEVVYCLGWESK